MDVESKVWTYEIDTHQGKKCTYVWEYKDEASLQRYLAMYEKRIEYPARQLTKLQPLMAMLIAAADHDGQSDIEGVGMCNYREGDAYNVFRFDGDMTATFLPCEDGDDLQEAQHG